MPMKKTDAYRLEGGGNFFNLRQSIKLRLVHKYTYAMKFSRIIYGRSCRGIRSDNISFTGLQYHFSIVQLTRQLYRRTISHER